MSDPIPTGAAKPPLFSGDSGSFATSRVVNTVFDTILAAVHEGRLQPGERISDSVLAEQLGVSRTPVREALQRLREIGIVEASASRFTRIAVVTPQQTAHAMVVWIALYGAVVTETIPLATPEIVEAMRRDHGRFLAHLGALDAQKLAEANDDFYHHLVQISSNPPLQRAINSVVHQVRLGSQHLPEFIDIRAIAVAQELLIAAARDHDVAAARQSLRMLSLIEVPFFDEEDSEDPEITDDAESHAQTDPAHR
jgi:DNA-binding GntR family transcriptional regulator